MSELEDDPSILNEEVLWRRIWPDWITPDGEVERGFRPKSVAFEDRRTGRVSASIARDTTKCKMLRCYPEHSLVAICAGMPRSFGYRISRKPTPEDPAHVVIFPSPSKGNARKLARAATWVVLRDTSRWRQRLSVSVSKAWRDISISLGMPCPERVSQQTISEERGT